jgi:tRNA-specific adenosine deaminase 3
VKSLSDEDIECLLYSPTVNKVICAIKADSKVVYHNPISHPIIRLIDKYAKEHLTEDNDRHLGEKKDTMTNEELNFTDQYFCEGLYVFTRDETCPMCTMALVHSRISRLYFLSSSSNGALKTKLKINNYENLNHEFLIFKVI